MDLYQKIASITQTLRLPTICILCAHYHRGAFSVCSDCRKLLSPMGPACAYCATALPDDTFPLCGQCGKNKPDFDQAVAAYHFTEPLRTLMHHFKYQEGLYLSHFLADLMLQRKPTSIHLTQCLIPVPMHPQRLQHRGFNQAVELAKYLAKRLQLPCDLRHCKKIINTAPQVTLTGKQRRKNLAGSFAVLPLPFQHVTVIDDLLTTGSTVNSLAKALKNSGVHTVDVWCCARA